MNAPIYDSIGSMHDNVKKREDDLHFHRQRMLATASSQKCKKKNGTPGIVQPGWTWRTDYRFGIFLLVTDGTMDGGDEKTACNVVVLDRFAFGKNSNV